MAEPDDAPPAPPLHRATAALRGSALRLGRTVAEAGERVRRWDEEKRKPSFVSDAEEVCIDARRHPLLLLTPALRTLCGLLALAAVGGLWPLLGFALLTAFWATGRFRLGVRRTATVAGVATVALVVLPAVARPVWCVVALLAWAAEDVADWYFDRLVVTDKRIYRRYGVLTEHAPSISLTGIAYLDASVPPLGRLLRKVKLTSYGTLSLDSVAQRDAPLSRFDLIPDVVPLSHQILDLRSKAMPKYPPPPP